MVITADKKVLCFGDSITQGKPGVTYLRFLSGNTYKNYGIGGDTLLGLSSRIKPFIEDNRYKEFIIQIGANDILLPWLRAYSHGWERFVLKSAQRGKTPCDDARQFAAVFEDLLNMISCKKKKVKFISIPCLGENTGSELNAEVDLYNAIISGLCELNGSEYIDFNVWQKAMIHKNRTISDYFLSKNTFDLTMDSLLSTYMHLDSRLSKKRRLLVTIDGVHLNSFSAKSLASIISEKGGQYGEP